MSEPTRYDTRTVALLASIALASLLALAATWIAALGRVPQQRAAVERLLGAQTGLDVRYGRLVVRLGFYGPEAEFSHIEMYQPGADAPVLRAPQMVARFESWRLLRGGQLRPGRVRVSGAEIDLRQLSGLSIGRRRADAAARIDMSQLRSTQRGALGRAVAGCEFDRSRSFRGRSSSGEHYRCLADRREPCAGRSHQGQPQRHGSGSGGVHRCESGRRRFLGC